MTYTDRHCVSVRMIEGCEGVGDPEMGQLWDSQGLMVKGTGDIAWRSRRVSG